MHKKDLRTAGRNITEARSVLIMLHGRGAPAEDILGLASYLAVSEFALIAPQATNYTWYPNSFLVPPRQNEPWLSSALALLDEVIEDICQKGVGHKNIYFTGFSQGACLTLEYVARHARPWGGVAAFTGGLIGDRIYPENYKGSFENTPIFIGSSDPDPHIPVERVHETTRVLSGLQASVKEQIYPGLGHTISQEEIKIANQWVFQTKNTPDDKKLNRD